MGNLECICTNNTREDDTKMEDKEDFADLVETETPSLKVATPKKNSEAVPARRSRKKLKSVVVKSGPNELLRLINTNKPGCNNLETIKEALSHKSGKALDKLDINEIIALEFQKQKEEIASKLSFSGSDKDSDVNSSPDKILPKTDPLMESGFKRSQTQIEAMKC